METALEIPTRLVKEVINGKKYYYKGYRSVLRGEKKIESIMGSSDLQATLASIIYAYLFLQLDRKTYQIVVSEPGLHLGTNSNFSNDIAIYRKADLAPNRDRLKYFAVAPLIAIEVDVRIESEDEGSDDFSYMFEKSSRLIESGTATVVWVLSRIQSLVVFAPGTDGSIQPQVIPWTGSYDLPVGIPIRLAEWLEAEGESDLLKS
jgi:Uma2 family endonuclease